MELEASSLDELGVASPAYEGDLGGHALEGSPANQSAESFDQANGGLAASSDPGGGSTGSSNSVEADFNCDGYADLAIGVPNEKVDGERAGAVNVIYGSPTGLRADSGAETDDQFFHQGDSGVLGTPEDGNRFGAALAAGDFDHDGCADLAIGAPGDSEAEAEAGVVHVLYGSDDGLTTNGTQLWHQDSDGIEGEADDDEHFGSALASGDFDGDGVDDLAVGVPGDILLHDGTRGGAVNIIFGFENEGLVSTGNQLWDQDTPGVDGGAEPGDRFGAALAAGNFNGDEADDLAIGVPGENLFDIDDAGRINVLYGEQYVGLVEEDDQKWSQDTPGIDGLAEEDDNFGAALAVGDFDGDGIDDVAIGVPNEDVGWRIDAGAVNVIYGDEDDGLETKGNQFLHQNSTNIEGRADPKDRFGSALAAGDFDHDGRDDLAVGVPFENLGSNNNNGGLVNVIYGSDSGLTSSGDELWHQDIDDVTGIVEDDDEFGFALTAGDFNGDDAADLAIGVPGEDVGSIEDAGWVNVIYGRDSHGLSASPGPDGHPNDQIWHQDQDGVKDEAETNDRFGAALR